MANPLHRSSVLIISLTATAVLQGLKPGVEANPWFENSSVLLHNLVPIGVAVTCECYHCINLSIPLTQQILAKQKSFYFEFRMTFWGNTFVFCRMVTGQKWCAFNVWSPPGMFNQKKMPCEQCVLEIRPDGIYRGEAGSNKFAFAQPWFSPLPPVMDESPTQNQAIVDPGDF